VDSFWKGFSCDTKLSLAHRCRTAIHISSLGAGRDAWVAARRERASLFCARVALDAPARGRASSSLEVAMEQSGSLPSLTARVRRLRIYRLLANAFAPLLAVALAVIVFRWMFPWLFSLLVYVWTADAFLLLVLAIPWLLVSCAFALGRIKCPLCDAPFASKFHLWVPKACQSCGSDITTPKNGATSNNRASGRDS